MLRKEDINFFKLDSKKFTRELWDKYKVYWIIPDCPECHCILSQRLFSDRLVCLVCGREFQLKEIPKEI